MLTVNLFTNGKYMFLEGKESKKYTAALLVIGNEILSGRTKESNVNFLARELSNLGIELSEARIVCDKKASIMRALKEFQKKYTYVFTTGGLGPTHDDITTESVASTFRAPIYRDDNALSMIKEYYHEANKTLDETAFKMADVPVGSTLILNDISGAPGFKLKNVFVFAGVPEVMQAMFNYAKIYLKVSDRFISRTIQVLAGESMIATLFGKLQRKYKNLELGSYPLKHRGKWCAQLVIRGKKPSEVNGATKELEKKLNKDKIEYFEEEDVSKKSAKA
jgi:molybdenum cofactor synthesis domain-containing protein